MTAMGETNANLTMESSDKLRSDKARKTITGEKSTYAEKAFAESVLARRP